MIKLIATDIDGTLVKDGSLLIDPEYMSVIDRLIDKGIIFVVCSGRQFSSEFKLFAPIKHKLLYITDGGTVVRTPKEILKTYPMDEDIWKGMCRMVRDELPACDYFAATPDFCFAEDGGSPIFHLLRDSYGFEMREVDDITGLDRNDIIFCLSSTKVRPNGSSIIPGVAETYEPEPWRMVITLRDASARIASRRELLPTFSRSHITVSFGSLSPGYRFSSSMYLIILSAILWERVFSLEFCM